MKKKLFVLLGLLVGAALSSVCFAERYRYALIQEAENRVLIIDYANKIPEENLSNTLMPLNTKKERFVAESGFRNISDYYYSGEIALIYLDCTKNVDDPDMEFIDSWGEFMSYVRGNR